MNAHHPELSRETAEYEPSVAAGRLELRMQRLDGCAIVRVAGEIDLSNSSTLREHLCGMVDLGHVVVDLSGVTFLDSTGLSAMIVAYKRASRLGSGFRLAGAHGTVLNILTITGLDVHLHHHADVCDAVAAALVARDGIPVDGDGAGQPGVAGHL